MTKCIGCGVILQDEDVTKIGYTPDFSKSFCQRCFRLTNYNDYKEIDLKINNNNLLNTINKKNMFTLFIVDYFNINEDTIKLFNTITNNKALVITKIDIIPKSIKTERITEYIKDIYKIKEDIIYISALKNKNINNLINYLNKRDITNLIVCGLTNSGKSSLINSIYNLYNNDKSVLTTSVIPNTTMDLIKVKIKDNLTIYDTPGLYGIPLEFSYVKKINTKDFIKPLTYQVKENELIKIEDILFIKNLSSKNSFTLYMSNDLNIDKIFSLDYKDKTTLEIKKNSDLVIKGIGFINIKKACKLDIVGRTDLIEVRPSFFGVVL